MKKGITIIEVCVSIAIFATLLLSMLSIFQQGYRYLGVSRERTTAVNLAQEIIEENSNWTQLQRFDATPGVTPHSGPVSSATPYALSSVTLNEITYTRSLTIADGPYSAAQLKKITATVSWSRSGRNFSVTLSTLKSDL
jgi:Tfp pilus assembly protein PilV